MKKVLTAVMAAAMVLSMAACSSSPSSSTPSSAPSSSTTPSSSTPAPASSNPSSSTAESSQAGGSSVGDVKAEMRMIWWGSQTRHDYTQAAIKVFEEKYPNITITPEFLSWDGYWERCAAMGASKNLPDLMQQDYKYITAYARNNQLIDLQPYVDSGILDLSDVAESAYSPGIVDGKLVAINLGMNTYCVLIDKEMFEKAGIELPKDTWTIAQYEEICQKLLDKKDELGIKYADSVGGFEIESLCYAFREKDLFFFNQDGSESFGWDKDTGKQIILDHMKREKEWQDKGFIAPSAVRTEQNGTSVESNAIVRGESAMFSYIWSNQAKAVTTAAGKNYYIVAYPNLTEKKMQYMKPSQFLSVTSDSKFPEQAALFVNEFTNNIDMNMELKAERGVPIAGKVRDALGATYEADSIDKQVFDYVGRMSDIANNIWKPEPTSLGAINTLRQNMLLEILEGGDPDAAFEKFYTLAMDEFSAAG